MILHSFPVNIKPIFHSTHLRGTQIEIIIIIKKNNEPPSESSIKRTFSTKHSTSNTQENNIYINNNLTYGDALQTTIGSLTRILGHNVNGIESFNFATLELMCDSMRKFHIDIARLSETNLHFNTPQVKKSIQQVIRKFWSEKQ